MTAEGASKQFATKPYHKKKPRENTNLTSHQHVYQHINEKRQLHIHSLFQVILPPKKGYNMCVFPRLLYPSTQR